MLLTFVFIQFFKLVCTFLCALFAFKIASSKVTATSTYVIFMLGAVDALCVQVYNATKKTGVDAFLNSANPYGDIFYQVATLMPFLLFAAGFAIKLKALNRMMK